MTAWAIVTLLVAVPTGAAAQKSGSMGSRSASQEPPEARPKDDGGSDGIDPLLAIGGIVATAFISPLITGAVQRRADRQRFQQERKAAQQDDVRELLDDAAALLAPAATNLRDLAERGEDPANRPNPWSKETFAMGQRLRLRLEADHAVVTSYDAVLDALTDLAMVPLDGDGYKEAVTRVEDRRATFLEKARIELTSTVEEEARD